MRKLSIFCMFILSVASGFAQNEVINEKLPLFKSSDFFISKGGITTWNFSNSMITMEQYETFIPDAKFHDYESNKSTDYSNFSTDKQAFDIFGVAFGFKIRNKDKTGYKKNLLLRIGLNYVETEHDLSNIGFRQTTNLDTIYNTSNNDMYFVDGVYSKMYSMKQFTKRFQLDASLIYRTNQEKMFSVYGGLGLNLGLAIQTIVQVSESENSYTYMYSEEVRDSYISRVQGNYYNDNTTAIDHYNSKGYLNTTVYMPLGVDIHLSKNEEKIYSLFHLFLEARPSINFFTIKELGNTYTQIGVQTFFGVRVSI